MRNKFQKIIFLGLIAILVMPFFNTTYAQAKDSDYTFLAPLPGTSKTSETCTGTTCKTDLQKYLPGAFNLSVAIAAVLAFIMITFGGITYAVSDSISGKEDGKKYIENALWGLLLVIGAYIILYTINPQILDFKLSIPKPDIKAAVPTITAGVPMTDEQKNADNEVRRSLLSERIETKPACTMGQTTNCVNLNGLPSNAVSGIKELATQGCKCYVFITGGTEGGHATHGDGAPIVDLRPNAGLNAYILGSSASNPPDRTTRVKTLPNGQRVTYTFETAGGNANGTSSGAHWHVVIQ